MASFWRLVRTRGLRSYSYYSPHIKCVTSFENCASAFNGSHRNTPAMPSACIISHNSMRQTRIGNIVPNHLMQLHHLVNKPACHRHRSTTDRYRFGGADTIHPLQSRPTAGERSEASRPALATADSSLTRQTTGLNLGQIRCWT